MEDLMRRSGLEAIFLTRAEMSLDSDEEFEKVDECIDIMAFGLESFRSSPKIPAFKSKLSSCLAVRILTINPSSDILDIRDDEENKCRGTTRASIEKLHEWVISLQKEIPNANIQIRYYDSLPQDFYWRQDGVIYIGPYLYGKISQQTITYKFRSNSEGYDYYKRYFDELWDNKKFAKELTS